MLRDANEMVSQIVILTGWLLGSSASYCFPVLEEQTKKRNAKRNILKHCHCFPLTRYSQVGATTLNMTYDAHKRVTR